MITTELKFWLLALLVVVIIPDDSLLERISTKKCKEYVNATQKINYAMGLPGFPKREIITNKCLHKSIALIVGGTEAKKHEFPHQALLGYDKQNGIEWNCGGSLISSNFVLTAAHCIKGSDRKQVKYVKLGMNRRLQSDEKVFVYGVLEISGHSGYRQRTFNNDIALLKLNGTVEFTEYLYPACLPTNQPEYPRALVTGFGKTGRFHADSEVLMKVLVDKYSHSDCQNIFRNIKIQGNSMICYGNKTHPGDACKGDSGGPIQVGNDDEAKCTYKIIGVVSFGNIDCGKPGVPGVYANVFNYIDWIESIVWPNET